MGFFKNVVSTGVKGVKEGVGGAVESTVSAVKAPTKASMQVLKGDPLAAAKTLKEGGKSQVKSAAKTAGGAGTVFDTIATGGAVRRGVEGSKDLNPKKAAEAKKAEEVKKTDAAEKEKARASSNEGAIADISKALDTGAKATKAAGDATSKALDLQSKASDDATKQLQNVLSEKSKLLDEKQKQIEGLTKWHQGLVTSYEDIATRYKNAVTGLDAGERKGMEGKAKQDFQAMSAMGQQGANVAGGGPMQTGSQQQLMGAMFQQQATTAYSNSQKNISAIDEQRRAMQMNIVQNASADERSNRQLGYNMESGQIQQGIGAINNQVGMAQQGYGASMTNIANQQSTALNQYGLAINTIGAQTNANAYGGQARLALNNTNMQAGFAQQALDIQRNANGKSNSWLPLAGGIVGGAAGAYFGGPAGAAAGYGVGTAAGTQLAK